MDGTHFEQGYADGLQGLARARESAAYAEGYAQGEADRREDARCAS